MEPYILGEKKVALFAVIPDNYNSFHYIDQIKEMYRDAKRFAAKQTEQKFLHRLGL